MDFTIVLWYEVAIKVPEAGHSDEDVNDQRDMALMEVQE